MTVYGAVSQTNQRLALVSAKRRCPFSFVVFFILFFQILLVERTKTRKRFLPAVLMKMLISCCRKTDALF